MSRKSWKPSKKLCICPKHLLPHYFETATQGKRYRLVMKLNPAPTIFDPEQSHLSAESKHLKSPVSDPKKSPTKRV